MSLYVYFLISWIIGNDKITKDLCQRYQIIKRKINMRYQIYVKPKGKIRAKKYFESNDYNEFVKFYRENYYRISNML